MSWKLLMVSRPKLAVPVAEAAVGAVAHAEVRAEAMAAVVETAHRAKVTVVAAEAGNLAGQATGAEAVPVKAAAVRAAAMVHAGEPAKSKYAGSQSVHFYSAF